MTFHKGKVFTKECKLPDCFMGKVYYIYPKEEKLQRGANSTPPQQQAPRRKKAREK
jgi:hypothetical protein